MAINLRRAFEEAGVKSARELMNKTGSSEKSLYRQAQIAGIDFYYRQNRGMRGPFGLPLEPVEFEGKEARREYCGGTIKFLNGPEGPGEYWMVDVRYVGFECLSESAWDQSSGADEPYFTIGVVGTNGSNTMKFGPYASVNTGTRREDGADIVTGTSHHISPPITLVISAMEHDFGSVEEAETQVRQTVAKMEEKLDQAASIFMSASIDNHVMPEWLRDIVIGEVPEWIASWGDLADDEVGKKPIFLFDYKPKGQTWEEPKVKGKFGDNEYTDRFEIGDDEQGRYALYFKIGIWRNPAPEKPA